MTDVPSYPTSHGLLDGKSVVITAAAGAGIGFATAKRCVEEGARVAIGDIHERRLAEAAEQLAQIGGEKPPAVLCNVTSEDDVQRLFGAAIDAFGHVDVMVNNAGLGGTTNLVDMTERGQGVIVNNASVLGWRAQVGQAHYAAAKAGVMALTRCAAIEAAPFNVRVNAVSPSLATHPFLVKVMEEEVLAELTSKELFGRGAEPWEVANVIVFLASDYSSYMTGEIVSVSSQHP